MFSTYWPVLTLVSSLIIIAVFVTLKLAGRLCGARHQPLPERHIDTYLPEQQQQVRLMAPEIMSSKFKFMDIHYFVEIVN